MGICKLQLSKIALAASLAVQLIACTEKPYGPPANQAPIETQGPSPVQSASDDTPSQLAGLPNAELLERILSNKTEPSASRADEIYSSVLRPLVARMLSSDT